MATPGTAQKKESKRDKKRKPPTCDYEPAELSADHSRFLSDTELLLTSAERDSFLCLRENYQRDAFIEQFWKARDPYPDTARNEFRDQWERRIIEVRQIYDDPKDVRAEWYLLNGQTNLVFQICPERSAVGIEVWFHGFGSWNEVQQALYSQRLRSNQFAVVFHKRTQGAPWRVWYPGDDLSLLSGPGAIDELGAGCLREELEAAMGVIALMQRIGGALGFAYEKRIAEQLEPIEPPSNEWLLTFASYSTDIPPDAPLLDAELELSFPGRKSSRTIVQMAAFVDTSTAQLQQVLDQQAYAFELIGQVLRLDTALDSGPGEEKLFDSFRYRFEWTQGELTGGKAPLVAQRYLRPGSYRLVLRIDDLHGEGTWHTKTDIEVPRAEDIVVELSDADLAAERIFAEANKGLGAGEPSIEIIEPGSDGLLSGYLRFDTRTTGPIEKVVFEVNGKPVLTKTRAPFSVDLGVGNLPRSQLLRVVAFDDEGKEIASDDYLVNGSPYRFAVRLVDPVEGHEYSGSIRVRAEVTVPEDRAFDRLELYRDEHLFATLYQEPFTQPVELISQNLAVIRAVGFLEDGTSVEDVALINGPGSLEEVRVDLVELYTSVVGSDGHLLLDLVEDDFLVKENDVVQTLTRFERVDNTPIRGTILLDVSASMEERLEQSVLAAAKFFDSIVTERDQLSVVTFNDRPQLVSAFTRDRDDFAKGLLGLRAERGTALYDSLVFSLFHLNGLPGQRVLLLLSDGMDEHSRYGYEDALEYARRSEAAIYPIGLSLPKRGKENPRELLSDLANDTGGRAFFLDDVSQLDEVYEEIGRELRSKYLLTYQSTNQGDTESFRRVIVAVRPRGALARTIRGYYP